MIEQGISKVEQLVKEGLKPVFTRIVGDPAHVAYLYDPKGNKMERVELTPGKRSLVLANVADLIALGKTHFDATVRESARMLCFYNDENVTLVWDHVNGRESAVVPLATTEEYDFFEKQRTSPLIEVAELRHWLRVKLRKTFSSPDLVEQVSKLAFVDQNTGQVAVNRGKESMGQSINQQVQEPDNLPDAFQTFTVRKYANPDMDIRFPVQCVLDPDTKTRRWYLQPTEDSWIDFDAAHAKVIGDQLRSAFKGTGVDVYEGTYEQAQPLVPGVAD